MFLEKISFDFKNLPEDSYLNKLPYKNSKRIDFNKKIIFLTGDNGIGKSTLIETLAYFFNMNIEGGSSNFILDKEKKPELLNFVKIFGSAKFTYGFFFRSDTFFNIEKTLDRYGEDLKFQYNGGEKTFDEQSHGESFMNFFKNRLGSSALYFFDEPENALSFENQLSFLFLLKQFEKQDNQIIMITHSPVLLSYPNAQIINISEDEIKEITFEESTQFNNLKNFLNNYKVYQKEILNFDN